MKIMASVTSISIELTKYATKFYFAKKNCGKFVIKEQLIIVSWNYCLDKVAKAYLKRLSRRP